MNAFATLLIDTFSDPNTNALGFFHGLAGETAIGDFDETNPGNELKVNTGDIDGKQLLKANWCWSCLRIC